MAQGRHGEVIVVQGHGVRPARWDGAGVAIDAGMEMGVAHDLAQTPRPQGESVDIGAYEATITSTSLYLPLVNKE
jgi:hypothetical protein